MVDEVKPKKPLLGRLPRLSHKITAYAQIILSAIYTSGYFHVLYDFMHGKVNVPDKMEQTFTTLLGVLTTGEVLILTYWFQRQRTSEDPQQK
jgi:hypothetical protein